MEYHTESRRGIPFARNAAIKYAGDVDFVALIDDDEIPAPLWLDELLRVQNKYGSDLVAGRVETVFEQPPPLWVKLGKFHEHMSLKTGVARLPQGASNLLIRRAALNKIGQPFD